MGKSAKVFRMQGLKNAKIERNSKLSSTSDKASALKPQQSITKSRPKDASKVKAKVAPKQR